MDKELQQAGFDVKLLTETQKDIIMQPSYAPENYAHDGEFSPEENLAMWLNNLKRAGLTLNQITKARKMHGL